MFYEEFDNKNLSLFHPKKDQCDLCIRYKCGNTSEEAYTSHIQRKIRAREEKQVDKDHAEHVYTLDLEAILLSPILKASTLYYKKKLIAHNYTIFNLKTKDGYCYLWHEGEGGVTSNEFASILYSFLETKANVFPGEEVILYSDGCNYQNCNSLLANSLLHLSQIKNFTITQKFLVSGHTQMECDSMHSAIERSIQNMDMYTPACYLSALKRARTKPKPY